MSYSFKRYYQNPSLVGSSDVKFRCFSVEEPVEEPIANCITFTGEEGDFTLSATKVWDGTVQYSTDTSSWTDWDGSEVLSSNSKLYLRGINNTTFKESYFTLSAKAKCSGNIQTLLQYDNPPIEVSEYCYYCMFYECENLTQAPDLPAITLGKYCYSSMFEACTNLTQAPDLPATTLAYGCYAFMFYVCENLTQAPELPATTLAEFCYGNMFNSCTSLTQAPELPATTLADECYMAMFSGCTSLTQAPDLPVTTLVKSCYFNMFNGCASLIQAPKLPATILVNRCYMGMFSGCTNLTQAPELPATILDEYCCTGMFKGCTNLTQTPELPATTLAVGCYKNMFYGCTGIALSETQTDEYTVAYRIPSEGSGVTATNSLTDMFTNTGGTFTGTPTINTTYYLLQPKTAIGTWVFNDEVDISADTINTLFGSNPELSVEFTSDGTAYSTLVLMEDSVMVYESKTVYTPSDGWISEAYKTIEITGGSDATSTEFLEWLEANATLQ